MTTASIVFCIVFTAVMAPMMWRIFLHERKDRKRTRKVARKRAWFEGKGEWPGYGLEEDEKNG